MTELDKMTADDLINAATKIIVQDGHDKKDLKELSRIRYFLSIQYKNKNMEGSSKEGLYNGMRASNTVAKQDRGMAVGKAENEAKSEAEAEYPNWRELNAEASGIGKILDTIEGFIINLQVEMKVTDQVYTGQ